LDPATVFLDAGGVLIEPDWERIAAVMARQGIRADAASLAAAGRAALRDLDAPAAVRATDDRSRGERFRHALLSRAGAGSAADAVAAAGAALSAENVRANLWSAVPAGVPGALDALRASGRRLVIVSNADGRLRALLRRLGLEARLDLVLDSAEVGFEKPDPRIFRAALERSGADPARTVHVGDMYEIDVVGARAAGLRAVLVDPAGLHAGRDCPRFPSLAAYAASLPAGR